MPYTSARNLNWSYGELVKVAKQKPVQELALGCWLINSPSWASASSPQRPSQHLSVREQRVCLALACQGSVPRALGSSEGGRWEPWRRNAA